MEDRRDLGPAPPARRPAAAAAAPAEAELGGPGTTSNPAQRDTESPPPRAPAAGHSGQDHALAPRHCPPPLGGAVHARQDRRLPTARTSGPWVLRLARENPEWGSRHPPGTGSIPQLDAGWRRGCGCACWRAQSRPGRKPECRGASRPTVKKSHARIVPAWERRNSDQAGPVRGAGSIPAFFKISPYRERGDSYSQPGIRPRNRVHDRGRCPLYVRAQPETAGLSWTQRDLTAPKATAREAAKAQLTGYLRRWWQVLGSNQRQASIHRVNRCVFGRVRRERRPLSWDDGSC